MAGRAVGHETFVSNSVERVSRPASGWFDLPVRNVLSAAVLVASVALMSGCSGSVSVGSDSIDKDDLASKVSSLIADQTGTTPDSVTCPDDLKAEEGEKTRCTATSGEDSGDVEVEVTSVKDGTASFSITPVYTVSKEEAAQQVSDQLTEQTGQTPDDVTCPEDLEAKVGESETCVITAGSDTVDVDVTVSSVDDAGNATLDIQVADSVN